VVSLNNNSHRFKIHVVSLTVNVKLCRTYRQFKFELI